MSSSAHAAAPGPSDELADRLDLLLTHPHDDSLPFYLPPRATARQMEELELEQAMRGADLGRLVEGAHELLPWLEREFLAGAAEGGARLAVVLGEAGAGKSLLTSHLQEELTRRRAELGVLPLRVELKTVRQRELGLGLAHVLQTALGLSDSDIELLRESRTLVLLDGYDELQRDDGDHHDELLRLFESRGAWPKARVLVTCRTRLLPTPLERARVFGERAAQRFLLPFSAPELEGYVNKRRAADPALPEWRVFAEALASNPSVRELARTPFVAKLLVDSLPALLKSSPESLRGLTRQRLYGAFVAQWFARETEKPHVRELLQRLDVPFEEGAEHFDDFTSRLAGEMYRQGVLTVQPEQHDACRGAGSEVAAKARAAWAAAFRELSARLDLEQQRQFLTASPLRVAGGAFSFVQKAFWEYFLAQRLLFAAGEAAAGLEGALEEAVALWGARGLRLHAAEPEVVVFVRDALLCNTSDAKAVALSQARRRGLWLLVRNSRGKHDDPVAAAASANAITALYAATELMNGADLRGCSLRGARLTSGMLEGADLRECDLRECDLSQAWLKRALVQGALFSDEAFGMLMQGHEGAVLSASFSSDGTRVLTGSIDNTARVWDAQTGAQLIALEGHTGIVTAASFSPDGTRVVTGSGDNTARIWDAETGAQLIALEGHSGAVTAASFSPDGTKIVTGSWDKTARLWDAETGAQLTALEGHADPVYAASFSPDGTKIVTGSWDDTARVWDAQTGAQLIALGGHEGAVYAASFSPDGTKIVTGSADNTARVWDAKTGAQLIVLDGHTSSITAASFSPDGTRVLTGSGDNTARFWNAKTGAQLIALEGHSNSATGLA